MVDCFSWASTARKREREKPRKRSLILDTVDKLNISGMLAKMTIFLLTRIVYSNIYIIVFVIVTKLNRINDNYH